MVDINPVAFVDFARLFELVACFVALLSLFDDAGLFFIRFLVFQIVSA